MLEIAVCDNEEIYTDIVESMLKKHSDQFEEPLNIHKFSDGRSLCDYMTTHNVDQLFLDVDMPEMNGIDVAEYIREELQNYIVTLFFITGTSGYERKLFEFQTFGFLEKPIDENKLVNSCYKAWVQESIEEIIREKKSCRALATRGIFIGLSISKFYIFRRMVGKLLYITFRSME